MSASSWKTPTSTTTEIRHGVRWTLTTYDDGTREEACAYEQELASMDGGPPRMAVRMLFERRIGPKGESWGWSRSDLGKPYPIQKKSA
jgi:hypothetical protein